MVFAGVYCYFNKCIDSNVSLPLYVNGILITGSSPREINHLKTSMSSVFKSKMNDVKLKTDTLANCLKLSKRRSSKTVEDREHMTLNSICFYSWKLDVCYGVH